MINGWLIYNKMTARENNSYIDWFIKEAANQDIHLQLLYREELSIGMVEGNYEVNVQGKKVGAPDFAIVRVIEPILQAYLEAANIMAFNDASTALICNHKSWTYLEVNKLNIPIVPTFYGTKDTAPEQPPLPYPVVVKEATGRSGKQVHYIQNGAEWSHCISILTSNEFIIQAANVRLGEDVRVFVIGKEIIAAVLRKNVQDFRANFKLGGQAILFELSEKEKKMIQKIMERFDFGLVGLDFLIGHNGELLFNEIEDVVGSRILSEVSNLNLLGKYVAFIKHKVLKRQSLDAKVISPANQLKI